MPLRAVKRPDRCYFAASGPDMEPPEWAGRKIVPGERRRWWGLLAGELKRAKVDEWKAGLDAYGVPLVRVKLPRRGRSDWHGRRYREGRGPALLPFPRRSLSRGLNLLRASANERRAVVHWPNLAGKIGPGPHLGWCEILYIHAVEAGVTRDVVGISPAGLLGALSAALAKFRAGGRRWAVPTARGSAFGVRFAAGRPARIQAQTPATVAGRMLTAHTGPYRPTPAHTEPVILIPWIFFGPDRETRLYRLGERWLIARGPWGWEVLGDGTTDLALLTLYEAEGEWERVEPDDEDVPKRVRRAFDAAEAGELAST